MTQETCPRCGAPRTEATPFCTNCGNPFASAGGPGAAPPPPAGAPGDGPPQQSPGAVPQGQWGPPGGPGGPGSPGAGGGGGANQGKIALIVGLVLLVLIGGGIAAAFLLSGDDDDDKAGKGSGSKDEFCEIWRDFDQADAGAASSLEEMRDIADRMREAGTPEDISDDAQAGIETMLDAVEGADSAEELDEDFEAMSSEDQRNVQAALQYAQETCSGEGTEEGTDEGSESTDGLGSPSEDDGPGTTTGIVSEEEFCSGLEKMEEFGDEEFPAAKAYLQSLAARGTPDEMPSSAKEGFDVFMKWVATATSPDDFEDFEEKVPQEDQQKIEAFMSYMQTTCSDDGGALDPTAPSSPGLSPDDGGALDPSVPASPGVDPEEYGVSPEDFE